jgi:hypothetical protein
MAHLYVFNKYFFADNDHARGGGAKPKPKKAVNPASPVAMWYARHVKKKEIHPRRREPVYFIFH